MSYKSTDVLPWRDKDVKTKKEKLIEQDYKDYFKNSPKDFIESLLEVNDHAFKADIKEICEELRKKFIEDLGKLTNQ